MAKTKAQYQCTACAATTTKWNGQCADCGEWNTLEETVGVVSAPGAAANGGRFAGYAGASGIINAADVELVAEARIGTGLSDLIICRNSRAFLWLSSFDGVLIRTDGASESSCLSPPGLKTCRVLSRRFSSFPLRRSWIPTSNE